MLDQLDLKVVKEPRDLVVIKVIMVLEEILEILVMELVSQDLEENKE